MHATTFSVLFTYPTLTRGKLVRVVSTDSDIAIIDSL